MGDTFKAWKDHWDSFAAAFAQPLQSDGLISRFVTNPNVTGAYAEAWVRWMVRSMLAQRFRISTGAVIRAADATRGLANVPQCDLIVWDPSELPAIFESGEFALVPLAAARAVIEVKRTMSDVGDLVEQLRKRRMLLPKMDSILGVVISHPKPLFNRECRPNWLACPTVSDEPPMTRLLDDKNRADPEGIFAFIYFLAQVAGHSNVAS